MIFCQFLVEKIFNFLNNTKKILAKRWKKGNWHIWPNGDPLFMGLIHWWLHLINISGCVGSQNDFCRKTKKKISIRRRRRKEGGNGWTSGGTTKLLIQGWRDFRGNTQYSKIRKKCNFKSAKKHYMHFQKWQKINFCTRKKSEYCIFGSF